MQRKSSNYKIKGMNQDLSYSAYDSNFSWENKNIRLTARNDNNFLSVNNEIGTLLLDIEILGKCIGTCVINDYLVVFTTLSGVDRIYRINKENDTFNRFILFEGNINLHPDYKIQTLPFYENEFVQKVYWLDGLNQPRLINIITDNTYSKNPNQFDFIQKLKLNESVTVEKEYYGGLFKAGTIQYAFTYFNKNGAESNIFYITPINYISPKDRAGSPDEIISNSFKITINDIEQQYDYIRIYSIYTSTLDYTREVRKVVDININLFSSSIEKSIYSQTNYANYTVSSLNDLTLYKLKRNNVFTDLYFVNGHLRLFKESNDNYDIIAGDTLYIYPGQNNVISIDLDGEYGFYSNNEIDNRIEFYFNNDPAIIGVDGSTDLILSLYDCSITTSIYNNVYSATYTDSNKGETVASDILLYVGGEEIVPQCMAQKSNTLFLGNFKLNDRALTPVRIDSSNFTFDWITKTTSIENNQTNSSYSYKPDSLNSNAQNIAKHFKYDETYRFGIQGQYDDGRWSVPIYLDGDKKVNRRYQTKYINNDSEIQLEYINGEYEFTDAQRDIFLNQYKFKRVRPVIVPLSLTDRTIVAQGIANNTLGVMNNRYLGKSSDPFSYPDYMIRSNSKMMNNPNSDGRYGHFDLLKLNSKAYPEQNGDPNRHIEIMGNWVPAVSTDWRSLSDSFVNYDRDFFFVDRNIINLWSPEFIHNEGNISLFVNQLNKIRLYGFANISGIKSTIDIDWANIEESTAPTSYSYSMLNYFNSNSGESSFDKIITKRLFPDINTVEFGPGSDGDKWPVYNVLPIWSPKHYLVETPDKDALITSVDQGKIDVEFTKFNRDSFVYFGCNDNLSDNTDEYSININTPTLLLDDKFTYHQSNIRDNFANGGLVNYSKNVEKNYVSNSYRNLLKFPDYDEDNFITAEVQLGMSVKYNTANHLLITLLDRVGLSSIDNPLELDESVRCIPSLLYDYEAPTGDITYTYDSNVSWYRYINEINGKTGDNFKQDALDKSLWLKYPGNTKLWNEESNILPIFDIYKTVSEDTRYGGTEDFAIMSNLWLPCGEPVKISEDKLVVQCTEGDTWIQRFDFLRVYPNDILQIPQHNEIVSFICESFINLDGRWDKNRYNTNAGIATTDNYGLLNTVYSQSNNYFSYNIIDSDLFKSKNFNNTIMWTKTKLAGELIDNWTNLNIANSLDIDGNFGELSSINLFNNTLYTFQEKGIATLLYNEKIQSLASDSTTIELTNGYKVPDYRYITNQYGCGNKWSIKEGKFGVYFVDYIDKILGVVGGNQVVDMSEKAGMRSWFNLHTDKKAYILSYDRNHNDLYIHDNEYCLNFSETLSTFPSFYDYVNVDEMKNIWDGYISIDYNSLNNTSRIWMHNQGEYNSFYGVYKPFSLEYLFSPDPINDKIFDTFEYRLDNQDIDWNKLDIENWYQRGHLNDLEYANKLKRKFNVNRVIIPRQSETINPDMDTKNSLNRIRSTWSKMKLTYDPFKGNKNKKFSMQDLSLTYTIW